MSKKNEVKECRFNCEVLCDIERCRRCGWNPEVAKKRIEKIAKKVGAE